MPSQDSLGWGFLPAPLRIQGGNGSKRSDPQAGQGQKATGQGQKAAGPSVVWERCGQGSRCALTAGRYRPVGSFMNYEPISIVFASKHRVTFIKNTRKTHLGKLTDFLLLTDLHKKQICPTTGNVVNEAGEGSEAPAQHAPHPCQLLHTRSSCLLIWHSCPPGYPPGQG